MNTAHFSDLCNTERFEKKNATLENPVSPGNTSFLNELLQLSAHLHCNTLRAFPWPALETPAALIAHTLAAVSF